MLGRKLSTLLHSEIGIFTALDLRLMTYKPEPNAGTGLHRLRDLKNEKPGAGACQKSSAPCTTLLRTQSLIFCPVSDDFS